MVRNGPIFFDAVDADAYVPRARVERDLLDAVEGGDRGILLVGPSGSGRTTTLNWLGSNLAGRRAVARVDGGVLDTPAALLDAVRVALVDALGDAAAPLATDSGRRTDFQTEAVRLQAAARALGAATAAVVTIDNLTHPNTIRAVFGGLRELLWESGHTYLVCARPLDLPVFLTPPADSFFRRRVELAPLTDQELTELLARSDQPSSARARLNGHGRLQPREVLAVLRSDSADDPQQAAAADRLVELSPGLSDLWAQLDALDRPVTLRDDDFMARVRRPPNTVRRQLNALVDAGLVTKLADRTGQPGRPAVAYQVRRSPAA